MAESPQRCRSARSEAGFSLLEMIAAGTVILLATAIAYPAFNRMMHRMRVSGYVTEASSLIARARHEAIRKGVPVVVQPVPDERVLLAYVNSDRDPALAYQPNPALPNDKADYLLGRLPIPSESQIHFGGFDNGSLRFAITDGLTDLATGENAIVFEPDGSVRDPGAIRVADVRQNYFELRLRSRAQARVSLLKYREKPPWGGAPGFFENGTHPDGHALWVWH